MRLHVIYSREAPCRRWTQAASGSLPLYWCPERRLYLSRNRQSHSSRMVPASTSCISIHPTRHPDQASRSQVLFARKALGIAGINMRFCTSIPTMDLASSSLHWRRLAPPVEVRAFANKSAASTVSPDYMKYDCCGTGRLRSQPT